MKRVRVGPLHFELSGGRTKPSERAHTGGWLSLLLFQPSYWMTSTSSYWQSPTLLIRDFIFRWKLGDHGVWAHLRVGREVRRA